MKKIECMVRPACLEQLVITMEKLDLGGMNITQVVGYGSQKGAGDTSIYRGVEYTVKLKEKLKVETVVPDSMVETVIEQILKATRTDSVGDGKIFIYNIEEAIRIRTGERGDAVI